MSFGFMYDPRPNILSATASSLLMKNRVLSVTPVMFSVQCQRWKLPPGVRVKPTGEVSQRNCA